MQINELYKGKVLKIFDEACIKLTSEEKESIEYADFGLSNINEEALNLLVYVNEDRYCAKEMVLLPNQTCPEHSHPNINEKKGKKETFRCRWGKVLLYVEEDSVGQKNIKADIPVENEKYYTANKEIELNPGEQYTIKPGTKHWFQAGDNGAVISEFSSMSNDSSDIFTNPNIVR